MARRYMCAVDRSKIIKVVKVVDLFYFKDISILTVAVSIFGVKLHCLHVFTRGVHPKFDIYCVAALLSLGSLEKSVHLLGVLDVAIELLPPRIIQNCIVSCILG